MAALPDFLTVEEAAQVLRIGRTSAYQLATLYLATDGREGLPVIRVGRLLRVPRTRLEAWAGGELHPPPDRLAVVSGVNDRDGAATSPRSRSHRPARQSSLPFTG